LKRKPIREKLTKQMEIKRIMITLYKKTNERKFVYFAKDKRGKMGRREKKPIKAEPFIHHHARHNWKALS
jgi:hypothetical protein